MTFLTFPAVENGIAVWGHGYQAVRLGRVDRPSDAALTPAETAVVDYLHAHN